jgi:hypothetical protein
MYYYNFYVLTLLVRETLATNAELAPSVVKEKDSFPAFNKRIAINLPAIVPMHHKATSVETTPTPVQSRDISLPSTSSNPPQNSMKGLALIVLGILGTQFPESLDNE